MSRATKQTEMIRIGYWRAKAEESSPLPWPGDSVRQAIPSPEKAAIVAHLRLGRSNCQWRGEALCRLCRMTLGSKDMTDGVYQWPEMLEHYVDVHDVQLPMDFILHVWKNRRDPGKSTFGRDPGKS